MLRKSWSPEIIKSIKRIYFLPFVSFLVNHYIACFRHNKCFWFVDPVVVNGKPLLFDKVNITCTFRLQTFQSLHIPNQNISKKGMALQGCIKTFNSYIYIYKSNIHLNIHIKYKKLEQKKVGQIYFNLVGFLVINREKETFYYLLQSCLAIFVSNLWIRNSNKNVIIRAKRSCKIFVLSSTAVILKYIFFSIFSTMAKKIWTAW